MENQIQNSNMENYPCDGFRSNDLHCVFKLTPLQINTIGSQWWFGVTEFILLTTYFHAISGWSDFATPYLVFGLDSLL